MNRDKNPKPLGLGVRQLHWDMSLDDMPVRLKVQGVLYLVDMLEIV